MAIDGWHARLRASQQGSQPSWGGLFRQQQPNQQGGGFGGLFGGSRQQQPWGGLGFNPSQPYTNPFRRQQTQQPATQPGTSLADLQASFDQFNSQMVDTHASQVAAQQAEQQRQWAAQLNALKSEYPTTPPSLSREEIAGFEGRRRAATRALQEAMARRESDEGRLRAQFEQFSNRLERQSQRDEEDMRRVLAGRGTAFSPRFMGRGLRDIRDREADALSEGRSEKAEHLAALEQMVAAARRQRDLEHAAVDADMARARTQLERLFRSRQSGMRTQMSTLENLLGGG